MAFVTALDADLVRYLAARDQQRTTAVRERLDQLSLRERWLVHDAAVMGYVQGAMAGEVAARTATRTTIPKDSDVVAEVVMCCQQMADRYPVLAGSLRDLAELLARTRPPVSRLLVAEAVALLGGVDLAAAFTAVDGLVEDGLLTVNADGLLDGPGE